MAVTEIMGGSGSVDDRGIARRTLVFICDEEAEVFTAGPASHLGLGKKPGGLTWDPTPAGKFKASVAYEGIAEDGDEVDPERKENFEWLQRKSEEPIEAHPLIDKIMEVYGGTADENGKIQFPRFMPAAAGADGLPGNEATQSQQRNPMYGRESYLLRSRILRWKFFSREYPEEWEAKDGLVIDSAPGGHRPKTGRDFLVSFNSASPVGSGESFGYDCEIDFIESEKGGWPPSQALFADE